MRKGLLATALALVALGGVATSAQAAAPTPAEAQALGKEAYDYGFPLLEFVRVQREMTSVRCPDHTGDSPVNSLSSARRFADPGNRTVVATNTDTLYTIAHLDLAKGPLILSHPNMGKRYFSFQFLDPYTNVIGYVGTRTTGSKAGRFAIAWNGHGGGIPKGVKVIRSKYRRVWMIGRTLAGGNGDIVKARKVMARYRLTDVNGKARTFPRGCKPGQPIKRPTPTGGAAFLDSLGPAMEKNPPPKRDRAILARLARVGIGPGRKPADANLPPDVLAALYAGVGDEAAALPTTAKLHAYTTALANGGWYSPEPKIGAYGTDYGLRAIFAAIGLGANTRAEAVYPSAIADSSGSLLTGSHSYRIVIPPGDEPPVRYFWSLTLYDSDGFLVANPIRRYSIGSSHPPLIRRSDGSIVIVVSNTDPADSTVNWLPAPPGGFRMSLRLYGPLKSALNGTWQPPPVTRTDG